MFINMSLAKRLSIGFAVVISLIMVLGGVAYLASQNSTQGFVGYREMARDTNLAGRVQSNMLMVRMSVKNYIISHLERDKQDFEKYWAETQKFMATAQVEINKPSRAALIDEIDDSLTIYRDNFEVVVSLINQRNHLVKEKLDALGPEIEKSLTAILVSARNDGDMTAAYGASLAMRNLLLMRLYASKFLNNNEPTAVKRFSAEYRALNQELTTLDQELQNPQRRQLLLEVNAKTSAYFATLNQVVDVINQRNQIITSTLDTIGPDIAEKIEQVKLDIKSVQDQLGPELVNTNDNSILWIKLIVFIAIVIAVAISFLITQSIIKQLGGEPREVIEIAKRVANGELDMELPNNNENPDSLYAAIKLMVNQLKTKVELALQIADGDLSQDVKLVSDKDLLSQALQKMAHSLNDVMTQIQTSAEQISQGSNHLLTDSDRLAEGTASQAASVQEISSSLEQLSQQTNVNADNAVKASQAVESAKHFTELGSEKMKMMANAMVDISQAGQRITDFVNEIDDIAAQTNLLALNAAIEAARAGEQGRGFAVVADEVRQLASRSTLAAEETKKLVDLSAQKTQAGSDISIEALETLNKVVEKIHQTANIMLEIANSSSEQAQGVTYINQGVSEVDRVIQENVSVSKGSSQQAQGLSKLSEQLDAMLGGFLLAK